MHVSSGNSLVACFTVLFVAVNPLATSPPVAPTLCTYACISADTKLSTDSDDVCKSSTCFISCATAGAGAKKYLFLRPAQQQRTSEINVSCARQRSANGVCDSSHVRVCDASSRAHGQATQCSRSHALPVHPQRQARRTATDHGVGHIHTVTCHLLHAPTGVRLGWHASTHCPLVACYLPTRTPQTRTRRQLRHQRAAASRNHTTRGEQLRR